MSSGADIDQSAILMEEYARHLKAQLPAEHQAIIDALVFAESTRRNDIPPTLLIAKLRGAAMQHRQHAIVLSSHMEILANKLDQRRKN